MLNFNTIMIGSTNVKEMAEFYEKVFQRSADMAEEGWFSWQQGNTNLALGEHSEAVGKSKEPVRIILNFETSGVKDEFERIKSFGANVIKEPYEAAPDAWIATFADPDGNYFQLVSPWEPTK